MLFRSGRGDYPLSLELPALRLLGAWISQGIISIDHKQQVTTASLGAVNPLTPGRGVRSYRSSERFLRAGAVFADVRFVQRVAWRVVPRWSPGCRYVRVVDAHVSSGSAGPVREPRLERAMPVDAVPGSTIPEDREAEALLQDGSWV